jgi:hypothetical protein
MPSKGNNGALLAIGALAIVAAIAIGVFFILNVNDPAPTPTVAPTPMGSTAGPKTVTWAGDTVNFGSWKIWTNATSLNVVNRTTGYVMRFWADGKKPSFDSWTDSKNKEGMKDHPDFLHFRTWSIGVNPTDFVIQSRLTGNSLTMKDPHAGGTTPKGAFDPSKFVAIKKGTPLHYNNGEPDIIVLSTGWKIVADENAFGFEKDGKGLPFLTATMG